MNYILAAILTNIGWATGDIFGAKSARKIGGENTAFWVVLLSTVIVVPLALLQGWPQLTLEIIFLSLVLAVIIEIAYFCFTKALEIGNPPLVGAITGAFPAIVVVLSVLFFNESLNSQQVLAVALTIFGII
jgi:drug/metabolite transporter (DMT)-like permease